MDLDYFYRDGMRKRDKFFEYMLSWLVFIGVLAGSYLVYRYGIGEMVGFIFNIKQAVEGGQ